MIRTDYLPSGLQNSFDFDCLVGNEYAIPTEDFTVLVSINGVVSSFSLEASQSNSFTVDLPLVYVDKGEVSILKIFIKGKTSIGTFTLRRAFKVIDIMDVPTDAFQVKRVLGLTDSDLTDSEVPVEACYLETYKLLTEAFHSARETDFSLDELYARFLNLFCALKVIPSLYIRLAKKEKNENAEFTRLADAKSLQDLQEDLRVQMQEVLKELGAYIVEEQTALPTILAFALITPDRITGA